MRPDCSQLPAWVRWIAQDFDGSWWAYEHEPNQADRGWYENEVGRSALICKQDENRNWAESLQKINDI